MGKTLVSIWRTKIKKEWKFAFTVTFLATLLIHGFKFLNRIPGNDSLGSFYDSMENLVVSGRWFLSTAGGLSSYFDIDWVLGLLCAFYLAIGVAILLDIFQVKNPVVIVLTAGLIVGYPSVAAIFFYGFTADAYMLSVTLVILAVRMLLMEEKSLWKKLLAGVCICLSCGIYQSSLSFGMLLSLCYFFWKLAENRHTLKEYLQWAGIHVLVYSCSILAYYLIWKISLHLTGLNPTSYRGIDQIGSYSLSTIPLGIKNSLRTLYQYLFMSGEAITPYVLLNMVLTILGLLLLIAVIWKSGLYRRPIHLVMGILCFALMPFVVCIWVFALPTLAYSSLMFQSLSVLYVFVGILADRWFPDWKSNVIGVVLAVTLFNNALIDNISYLFLYQSCENTKAMVIELLVRVDELSESDDVKVAFIGNRNYSRDRSYENKTFPISDVVLPYPNYFITTAFIDYSMRYMTGPRISAFASEEETSALAQLPEVAEMNVWPYAGSVKMIDDFIVVKLS